jgi:hypothetical protein
MKSNRRHKEILNEHKPFCGDWVTAAEPSTEEMAGVMEDEATPLLWCIFYSALLEHIGDLKCKRSIET